LCPEGWTCSTGQKSQVYNIHLSLDRCIIIIIIIMVLHGYHHALKLNENLQKSRSVIQHLHASR